MKRLNEDAAAGIVATVMVLIIIIVGAISFIMIVNAFNTQYDTAILDPSNSTGIYLNNTTPYESVKVISTGITDNMGIGIMLAFLLAVITIVMLIWAMLKRGD